MNRLLPGNPGSLLKKKTNFFFGTKTWVVPYPFYQKINKSDFKQKIKWIVSGFSPVSLFVGLSLRYIQYSLSFTPRLGPGLDTVHVSSTRGPGRQSRKQLSASCSRSVAVINLVEQSYQYLADHSAEAVSYLKCTVEEAHCWW